MIRTSLSMTTILILAVAMLGGVAEAKNSILNDWVAIYPSSASDDNAPAVCQLCHQKSSGGNGWNAYGWRIRQFIVSGSSDPQAILQAATFDSDLDPTSSTNLVEINADTQPGWTDGANNTIYFKNGSTQPGQSAPSGFSGTLDPVGCGTKASATSYGAGKPGTNGVPTLTSTNPPVLGGTGDLTIGNGVKGGTALLFFGFGQTSIPFDGGTLLVVPALTLALPLGGTGGLALPVQLPSATTLCGFQAYFQVMIQDPGATGFYQSAQSAGLQWVLGA